MDEDSLKNNVLRWLSHYFPKDAKNVADILYCFATNQLHQQITQDAILDHLESRGFLIAEQLKQMSKQPLAEAQATIAGHQQIQSSLEGSLARRERKADRLASSSIVELAAEGLGEIAVQAGLAKRLLDSKHFRTAKGVLNELRSRIEASPDIVSNEVKAKIYNNLGVCVEQHGDSHEAATLYRKAHSLQPNDPKYRANLAITYLLEGRPPEALAIVEALLTEVPRDLHAILVKTQILHDLDRTNDAIQFLKKKMEEIPSDAYLYNALGYIYSQAGHYDDAIENVRQATRLNGNNYSHNLLLADVLGIRASQVLHTLRPLPWQIPENILNDLQEAYKLYGAVLGTMPTDEVPQQYARCLAHRAATRMPLGEFSEALSDIQKSLEVSPNEPVARLNRAILLRDQANAIQVEDDFKFALSRFEEPVHVLVPYALFLLDGNRPQDCIELLDSYQEHVKSDPYLQLFRARAEDRVKGGHASELEHLRKNVKEHPQDAIARCNLATLLGETGKDDEAELEFNRALKVTDDGLRAEVELDYARYLRSIKEYDRALPLYEKNVPLDRDSPFLSQYIGCFIDSQKYPECLELLRGLPKNVQKEKHIADVLAQLEEYFGNCEPAADIWKTLSEDYPNEARYSVHLASCLFRLGNQDAKRVVYKALPAVEKASPYDRMCIAQLLASMDLIDEGIRQGYFAVMAAPDDPEFGMAYAGLLFFFERKDLPDLEVTTVTQGCVVDVAMESHKHCWYLPAQTDGLPAPPNCTTIREATVQAALTGKKVGDGFSYHSEPLGRSIEGVITQIRSPQVKLLHEILKNLEYLAPDLTTFRKFDVSKGLDEVKGFIIERGRHDAHIHRLYEKEGLPICSFAKLLGKDQNELVMTLLESPGMRLDMLPGSDAERNAENDLMRTCNHAVVDLATLVLLSYLDMLDFLKVFSEPVVVGQSTLDRLQEKILYYHRFRDGYQVIGAVGDFIRLYEVSAEVVQERIKVFERIRNLLTDPKRCRLQGKSLHPHIPKSMEKYFGEEMFETMNIALDLQIPLLLGDRRVLALTRLPQVISPRAVVVASLEKQLIDEQTYVLLMAVMARFGVWFVSIDAKMLGIAVNSWISSGNPKDLYYLLDTVTDESADVRSAANVLSHFVADLFTSGISDFYVTNATAMALAALCRKRGTGAPLLMFRRYVRPHLTLAPHRMDELEKQIRIWQRLNPITIHRISRR